MLFGKIWVRSSHSSFYQKLSNGFAAHWKSIQPSYKTSPWLFLQHHWVALTPYPSWASGLLFSSMPTSLSTWSALYFSSGGSSPDTSHSTQGSTQMPFLRKGFPHCLLSNSTLDSMQHLTLLHFSSYLLSLPGWVRWVLLPMAKTLEGFEWSYLLNLSADNLSAYNFIWVTVWKAHVGYFTELLEGVGWELEAITLIQVRDDGGLDQGGGGEKRSDSGWNWKLELTFSVYFAYGKVLERNIFVSASNLTDPHGHVGLWASSEWKLINSAS